MRLYGLHSDVEGGGDIGDTPGDLAAAHADGLRCVLFPSTRFPPALLAGADALAPDAAAAARIVLDWHARG